MCALDTGPPLPAGVWLVFNGTSKQTVSCGYFYWFYKPFYKKLGLWFNRSSEIIEFMGLIEFIYDLKIFTFAVLL